MEKSERLKAVKGQRPRFSPVSDDLFDKMTQCPTYSKLRDIWQALRFILAEVHSSLHLGPGSYRSALANIKPSCSNRQVNPFLFEAYSWAQFLVGQAILGSLGSTSQPSCPLEKRGEWRNLASEALLHPYTIHAHPLQTAWRRGAEVTSAAHPTTLPRILYSYLQIFAFKAATSET